MQLKNDSLKPCANLAYKRFNISHKNIRLGQQQFKISSNVAKENFYTSYKRIGINSQAEIEDINQNIILSSIPCSLYFQNLDAHIQQSQRIRLKKYSILHEGVYLLLKGKLVYIWFSKQNSYERRQFLESFTKPNPLIKIHIDPLNSDPNFKIGYGVLIQESQSVVFSVKNSVIAMQQCFLLKICDKTISKTNFYEKKSDVLDLIQNCHYQGIRNNKQQVFSINKSFLHTFSLKEYRFNQSLYFSYPSFGIIKQGQLIADQRNYQEPAYISRYTIVLPQVKYRAANQHVQILCIQKNPTLLCNNENFLQAMKKAEKTHKSLQNKAQYNKHFRNLKTKTKPIKKMQQGQSRQQNKQVQQKKNRKQQQKYKKQLNEFSKHYQEFMIIPMVACKNSLEFVNKQVDKKQIPKGKYKTPKILFDYDNSRINRHTPSLKRIFKDTSFSFSNIQLDQKKPQSNEKRKNKGSFYETVTRNHNIFGPKKTLLNKFIARNLERKTVGSIQKCKSKIKDEMSETMNKSLVCYSNYQNWRKKIQESDFKQHLRQLD